MGDLIHTLNEEIVKFRTASDKASKSAGRNTIISICLVAFSLVLSGCALFYGLQDYEGDKKWEQNQIDAINNLNESIKSLERNSSIQARKQDSIFLKLTDKYQERMERQDSLISKRLKSDRK